MTETPTPGYDQARDEYTIAGACELFGGISRATLDRWIPPGTPGRRLSRAPGVRTVWFSGELLRSMLLPAEDGAHPNVSGS